MPNYICPTINGDENGHMCSDCEKKEAEDFRKWVESGEGNPPKSIDDWENK